MTYIDWGAFSYLMTSKPVQAWDLSNQTSDADPGPKKTPCEVQGESRRGSKKMQHLKSGDSWMYPDPNVPRHGKSLYKPYITWVFMGKLSPRIPRESNKYHGSTRTYTRPCPLMKGTIFWGSLGRRGVKFAQDQKAEQIVL